MKLFNLNLYLFIRFRCINGGECIDGIDDFTCSCPPGLTGIYCECLILENEETDCNYTVPSTTTSLFSTTEFDLTTVIFPISSESTPFTIIDSIADTTTTTMSKTEFVPNTIESNQFTTTEYSITSTIIDTTMDMTSTKFETTLLSSSTTTESLSYSSELTEPTLTLSTQLSTDGEVTTTLNETYKLTTQSIVKNATTSEPTTSNLFPTTPSTLPIKNSTKLETTLSTFFTDTPESTTSSPTTTTTADPTTTMLTPSTETTQTTTTNTTTTTTQKPITTTTTIQPYTGIPDCIKIPCFNGGTCVGTSEGSRVSLSHFYF